MESSLNECDKRGNKHCMNTITEPIQYEFDNDKEHNSTRYPEQPDRVLSLYVIPHGIPKVCSIQHGKQPQYTGLNHWLIALIELSTWLGEFEYSTNTSFRLILFFLFLYIVVVLYSDSLYHTICSHVKRQQVLTGFDKFCYPKLMSWLW